MRLPCLRDVEGIVVKREFDPYLPEHAQCLKMRNWKCRRCSGRENIQASAWERSAHRQTKRQV